MWNEHHTLPPASLYFNSAFYSQHGRELRKETQPVRNIFTDKTRWSSQKIRSMAEGPEGSEENDS